MAPSNRKAMSLEAALEEERQEIENLLSQGAAPRGPPSVSSARSPSPYMSPRSPHRSMLDVGDTISDARMSPSHTGYRSMLDFDSPPPSAGVHVRSMLDIAGAPVAPSKSPAPSSAHTSPILSSRRTPLVNQTVHLRSMSDAAHKPADFGPRSPPLPKARYNDPTAGYQFSDIYATNVGQALPGSRRSAQPAARSSSIGEALRGSDLSNLVLPGGKGRSFGMSSNSKSKSPNNRFSLRSSSPGAALVGNRNQNSLSGTMMLDDGTVIDKASAYRRLSDANLIYGGTNLGNYVRKKAESDGHGRLERDNMSPYGEILPSDDSSDDGGNSSDEEDHRGRKLTTRADRHGNLPGTGNEKTAKSLLAAAEDERKQVIAQPQYRSLFDPEISVTSPSGERTKQNKGKQIIHPSTSFDHDPHSDTHSPFELDLESDVSAIKHAQRLEVSLTPIISTPEVHRSIRIIYRGEYNKIQQDALDEHRRLRKYLVATDLSDESTHALEWAIGTVLRDGDTLIAIYCMDEEASGFVDPANQVPDDPKSMREQAAAINAMARNAKPPHSTSSPSPFAMHRPSGSPHVRSADAGSNTPSPAPSFRGRSRLEEERNRAVQDITERVTKLLRKTQLQVRVIVECIHCKNPKHLITEVIDLVSPTLVILGSRGRSALKGTLLGSFSNYLVTKSSVPVMVARKRLRKKSKYQPPPTKQVNNLANPAARSLEMARID